MHGKGSIEMIAKAEETRRDVMDSEQAWETGELKSNQKPQFSRWVIAFENESEARRFVRVWHRKAYPFPIEHENYTQGEPTALVHAEFLW